MIEVRQTERFRKWLAGLRDERARARILKRLDRAQAGNLGDVVSVGGGVSEMRISTALAIASISCSEARS